MHLYYVELDRKEEGWLERVHRGIHLLTCFMSLPFLHPHAVQYGPAISLNSKNKKKIQKSIERH